MIILLVISLFVVVTIYILLNQPQFGGVPSPSMVKRLQKSPQYKNGKFHNIHFTPNLTEGFTFFGVLYSALFRRNPSAKPSEPIPTSKTNLLSMSIDEDVLIWFGHSSYFIQVSGKRFLIDPVMSGSGSPFPGGVRAFNGSDCYTVGDMPEIDYLLITHDHYDHLDYDTIKALQPKVRQVVCGLGVRCHFEKWGYDESIISELDWHDRIELDASIAIIATPTRHFSGRKLKRNNTLWCAYVLQAGSYKIYLGGDSGYDTHFKETGQQYGPFDLAILENGQYNAAWKAIHMFPKEVVQAAEDLRAASILPVHSSKFALSNHDWDEPLEEVARLCYGSSIELWTPMIGQKVNLRQTHQTFSKWWQHL